jgi:hypothetical protein
MHACADSTLTDQSDTDSSMPTVCAHNCQTTVPATALCCTTPPQPLCRPTGTPYLITPFSDLYTQPAVADPVGVVCRPGDGTAAASHCLKAYELSVTAFQSKALQHAVKACRKLPDTWFM